MELVTNSNIYMWCVRKIKQFGVVISVFLRDVNKICALFGFLRSVKSQKFADLVSNIFVTLGTS
jgi:hypothetical protein